MISRHVLIVCALVGCRHEETPRAAPSPPPSVETAAVAVVDAAPSPSSSSAALPDKCAAESPVDAPCTSYGGTYRIRLAPRPGAKEQCVVTKPVEATVTINGAATYKGMTKAAELAPLARALGLASPDLRIGAAVREGVCCVDLDLSDGSATERSVRVHLARGDASVNGKAKARVTGSNSCDATLDVEAELLR
jgi:hypothetical protein